MIGKKKTLPNIGGSQEVDWASTRSGKRENVGTSLPHIDNSHSGKNPGRKMRKHRKKTKE